MLEEQACRCQPRTSWNLLGDITVTEAQSLWESRFSQVARVCVLMGSPSAVHVLDNLWNTAHSPMETTFNLSENSQLTTPETPDAHSTCSSSTKRIPPVLEIPVPFFFKGTAFSTSYKVFVDSFTQSLIPNLTRITVLLPCHGQAHCPLIAMSPFLPSPTKEFRYISD